MLIKKPAIALVCVVLLAPQFSYSRTTRFPLQFEIKTVDATSGRRKMTFALGERVSVVFALSNRSPRKKRIKELQDTEIRLRVTLKRPAEDDREVREGVRGGTGSSYTDAQGNTIWTSHEPRFTVISSGQTMTVNIDDLRRFLGMPLDDGQYIIRAIYPDGQQAQCSFQVVIDEATSVPILERMLSDTVGGTDVWANVYLKRIRQPGISGRVVVNGHPLKGVWIDITGSEKTNIETRSDGGYYLVSLISGGTYTLTPSLEGYIFKPASITIKNLKSKLRGIDFNARRIRGE